MVLFFKKKTGVSRIKKVGKVKLVPLKSLLLYVSRSSPQELIENNDFKEARVLLELPLHYGNKAYTLNFVFTDLQ